MHFPLKRSLLLFFLAAALVMNFGCSRFQSTKNMWKGTKDLWYEYVSRPAEIDYSEIGSLNETEQALVNGMMSIDIELARLERLMSNADRTPTRAWADQFFAEVPWVEGFAGIRADGQVLGNIPAPDREPVDLDWVPLLYEPEKQSSRALRGDVQFGPAGPEVLLAATLYDGVDFVGVIACYFKMTNLIDRAKNSGNLVILTPMALLWSGYDYGSTPMAGENWNELVTKKVAGTLSNSNGTFAYRVRWLANLPIIFCVPESGNFPTVADGGLAGSEKYFPVREKKPVPELKPRGKDLFNTGRGAFIPPQEGHEAAAGDGTGYAGDAGPGSMRLQEPQATQPQSRVRERDLGSDTTYQRPARERRQVRRQPIIIPDMPEEDYTPPPQIQMPSPFGPGRDAPADSETGDVSTTTPEETTAPETSEAPAADSRPEVERDTPLLPGGRISPFGPHRTPEQTPAATEQAPASEAQAADTPAYEAQPAEAPAAEAPASDSGSGAERERDTPLLPGGRISPFGPYRAPEQAEDVSQAEPAS